MLEIPLPEEERSRISRLFVEIDRRTLTGEAKASKQSLHDWASKVRAYLAYFPSNAYKTRYGTTGGRVLTITTGEQRAANLKAITEKVGGRTRFWFTTFDLVTPETILTAPIWSVATRDGRPILIAE